MINHQQTQVFRIMKAKLIILGSKEKFGRKENIDLNINNSKQNKLCFD